MAKSSGIILAKYAGIIPAVSFGSLVGWLNGRLVQQRNRLQAKSAQYWAEIAEAKMLFDK